MIIKPNWIKSKKKTIDIINCEGSILKVEYFFNDVLFFKIIDQWNIPIIFLNQEDFIYFLDGKTSIRDSKGMVWNVGKSKSMFTGIIYITNEFKKQGIDLSYLPY